MNYKEQLKKVSENVYELPKSGNMNVPGKIFISEKLLEGVEENAIAQVANVAHLPGIIGNSIAMPDIHSGYGFPIGGVAAFDAEKGIICPGGIGYDISCSIRLLKTNLTKEDIKGKEEILSSALFRAIPSGVGKGGLVKIDRNDLKEILKKGANWAIEKGYGFKEDIEHLEEFGCMEDAVPEYVSDRAMSRGANQLGSVGAGNHFLEMLSVEEIFDEEVAKVFGLKKNQIMIMIHCGSRGLGHQVASDYIKLMEEEYGFENLPDRELINAPIRSDLGKKYYGAMCAAANFSFCNKQIIVHFVREALKYYFPDLKAETLYEVCHNIAKFEEFVIEGKKQKVCVHRKGATRSLGAGSELIPKDFQKVGQPVIIPGSMGTSSFVLVGTKKAEKLSFASTAHGSGRVMSRHEALRKFTSEQVKEDLKKKGIFITSGGKKSLIEEYSGVYKDSDEVVNVSDDLGIGNLVARMKPIVVVIG